MIFREAQEFLRKLQENLNNSTVSAGDLSSSEKEQLTVTLNLEQRDMVALNELLVASLSPGEFRTILVSIGVDAENICSSGMRNEISKKILLRFANNPTVPTLTRFLQEYVDTHPDTTELSRWCREKGITRKGEKNTVQEQTGLRHNNQKKELPTRITTREVEGNTPNQAVLKLIAQQESIQRWATENNLVLTLELSSMPPNKIWRMIAEKADGDPNNLYKNYPTYTELRTIADNSDMDLQAIKIWVSLFYKRITNNPKTSYREHIDTSVPFLRDALLRKMHGDAKRRSISISMLQETHTEALRHMQALRNGGESNQVESEILVCTSCGTKQHVALLNGSTAATPSCIVCTSTELSKEKDAAQKPQLDTVAIQEITRKIGDTSNEREVLDSINTLIQLYGYDYDAVRRFASRVVLFAHFNNKSTSHAKLPFEDIALKPDSRDSFVRELVLFAMKRKSIDAQTVVSLLQPKPGNREKEPNLLESNARTCYCADCGDVWLQNIDEVGLTQITDQPALATQGHEINQVACDNPDCKAETSNVYYTADFSPSYVTNPEEIIKKGNMGVFQYLHEHFSSEEIKRLIAEMMGDDSLSENLSFSDVQGAARELILHYGRRGSNLSLAAHIVKFRFESNLSGHSIAVQCQYCGRVASTRINNEGMILIDYCNSCANIDKWQVYRTPVQNETELTDNQGKKYVPYDMYGSYIRKANEEGVLPTMLHQTVLQSTALNS